MWILLGAPLLAICTFAQTVPDRAGSAKIEGAIVTASGDPLRKATVRLMMIAPAIRRSPLVNYSGYSDANGQFLFDDVAAGEYQVSAERTGYVPSSYGTNRPGEAARPMRVAAGQKLTGITIRMTPQALIAGRVLDEDGDPMGGFQVQLYRRSFSQGHRVLRATGAINTFPDGTFMFGELEAGTYYLSASDNRARNLRATNERPARRGPAEEYVNTYYPNTTDPGDAAPIALSPGVEARGIDVHMRRIRVFGISGVAIHAGGRSTAGVSLMLQRTTPAYAMDTQPSIFTVRSDGRFEFLGVAPGQYVIQAQPGPQSTSGSVPMLGRATVNLTGQDIDNVVLTLGPGPQITGHVLLEGVGPLTAGELQHHQKGGTSLAVQLAVAEGSNFGGGNVALQSDGTFQLQNLQPERFRVIVRGLPADCYVKSIRFAGQDATSSLLDLTSGAGGPLEIVVSPSAAEIGGRVRDGKGEAASDVFVYVWTAENPGVANVPRVLRTAPDGTFKLAGLAPGDYRLTAWEWIDPALSQDPDFRKQVENLAIALTLREGARERVELKLLPAQ